MFTNNSKRFGFVSRMLSLVVLAAGMLFTSNTQAAVTFSGTGLIPEIGVDGSAEAIFTISGNTLTVELTNTTLPRSLAQGHSLTGVVFDIEPGSPVLTLTNTALTPGSLVWSSETSSSAATAVNGSWTDQLGDTPLGEYGVATTGFAGAFKGNGMSLGNAGPDYGIVAANTFDGTNVAFGGSQFPFIQDSLTFTFFTGVSGISEDAISGVEFLFGTDGTGRVVVPEPSTFGLLAIGGLAMLARRRRSAR